jgi:hypothetical protein
MVPNLEWKWGHPFYFSIKEINDSGTGLKALGKSISDWGILISHPGGILL